MLLPLLAKGRSRSGQGHGNRGAPVEGVWVAAESVTVDSTVVRCVQLEDHGLEVLAIQLVCAGENRGGFASSRRPVEKQVRQLSCVDQTSDSRDDVLVRHEVFHVLGAVPARVESAPR